MQFFKEEMGYCCVNFVHGIRYSILGIRNCDECPTLCCISDATVQITCYIMAVLQLLWKFCELIFLQFVIDLSLHRFATLCGAFMCFCLVIGCSSPL